MTRKEISLEHKKEREERKKAFELVFKELSEVPMFMGSYDAKHGNKQFINGMGVVMEFVAYQIDYEHGEQYAKTFYENLKKSVDKAKNQ